MTIGPPRDKFVFCSLQSMGVFQLIVKEIFGDLITELQ